MKQDHLAVIVRTIKEESRFPLHGTTRWERIQLQTLIGISAQKKLLRPLPLSSWEEDIEAISLLALRELHRTINFFLAYSIRNPNVERQEITPAA